MNTKHTPGPWQVEPPWIVAGNDIIGEMNDLLSEWEANAALIAAAPRIKDALEDLLIAVNNSLVRAEPKVIAAMREARAALEEAAK